jgi:hypothetical protein
VIKAPLAATKKPVPDEASCSGLGAAFGSSGAFAAAGAAATSGTGGGVPAGTCGGPAGANAQAGKETGAPASTRAEISSDCRRAIHASSPSHCAISLQYGIPIASAAGRPRVVLMNP